MGDGGLTVTGDDLRNSSIGRSPSLTDDFTDSKLLLLCRAVSTLPARVRSSTEKLLVTVTDSLVVDDGKDDNSRDSDTLTRFSAGRPGLRGTGSSFVTQ